MSDTETAAKRTNRRAKLNYETNAVEIEDIAFPFGQLSEKARQHFALKGYAAHLLKKDDMHAAHALAVKGDIRSLTGKAETKPDPWVEAAANVHAEEQVKAAGVKPVPGKGVRASAEFTAAKTAALAFAGGWTREQRLEAKKHSAVVAEHAKLTGAAVSLGGLFSPAAPAEQSEAEAA